MIRFERVSVRFGSTWAVRDLDLEVAEGELLALVGASGSGKTTTLRLVNRLVAATEGVVSVGGRDVASVDAVGLRRGIGFVLQAIALFPHRTVAENVATVPRLLGWDRDRVAARVDALLRLVRLPPETYRDRLPHELSGGQQQRVGLARALAAEPPIVLMDEPLGALDPVTRAELQGELRRLHDALRLTTVVVTHDMAEALTLADRVAVMSEGRLVRVATPAALWREPGHPVIEALLDAPRKQAAALDRLEGGA
jgi:osmoprotectant transport system ATP-binding protein